MCSKPGFWHVTPRGKVNIWYKLWQRSNNIVFKWILQVLCVPTKTELKTDLFHFKNGKLNKSQDIVRKGYLKNNNNNKQVFFFLIYEMYWINFNINTLEMTNDNNTSSDRYMYIYFLSIHNKK